MTDRELTILLERDPETGMEAVIEGYSGFLWKVAAGILEDQEDVRDCVSVARRDF